MKRSGLTLAILLCMAPLTYAQESSDFRPASTNVRDAQYPRVDSKGRVDELLTICAELGVRELAA